LGSSTLQMAGGTLQAGGGGNVEIDNPVTLTADSSINGVTGSLLILTGADGFGPGPCINLDSYTLSVEGAGDVALAGWGALISGTGGITMNGTGTLTLSGANNSYTGDTNVNSGTLASGDNNAIGQGNTYIATGANVNLGSHNQTFASLNGGGNLTGTGVMTIGAGDFSGAISGTGGQVVKDTAGTLTLSGNNTYSGGTTINGGTLASGANNAIGQGTTYIATGANVNLGSHNQTFASLNGGGNLTGTGVMTIGAGDFSGAISGTGGQVVKDTAGTLTLSGTNTYTGSTTINGVNGGVLDVTGSTTNSAITVASGATLEGNGHVGSVNVSAGSIIVEGPFTAYSQGGILAPGDPNTLNLQPTLSGSTGNILTAASLTVNGSAGFGSTLQYNLYNNSSGSSTASAPAGGTVDLVTGVFSGLNVSSTNQVVLDFNASTVGGNNVYDLVEYGSTTGLTTADFVIEDLNLTSGSTDSLVFNSSLNALQLDITLQAVPEPSTWTMLLGGLSLLAFWCKRTRRVHVTSSNHWFGGLFASLLGLLSISVVHAQDPGSDQPTPHLVFSTYLGGSKPCGTSTNLATFAQGVACDVQGNIYVTGGTEVANLPVLHACQPKPANNSAMSAFVAKYSPVGKLLWCTYLGGDKQSMGTGVVAMPDGGVAVAGLTSSDSEGPFPTMNAFQENNNGPSNHFVTVLNASGNIRYSTYLGGSGIEGGPGDPFVDNNNSGNAIAVDAHGLVYRMRLSGYV